MKHFLLIFFLFLCCGKNLLASDGLPQLRFSDYPSEIFWVLISVGCLFLWFNFLIVPRLTSIFVKRDNLIQGNLQTAEQLQKKSDDMIKMVKSRLMTSRLEADQFLKDQFVLIDNNFNKEKDSIKNDIKNRFDLATQEIEKERDLILKESDKIATELAFAIIEKIGLDYSQKIRNNERF